MKTDTKKNLRPGNNGASPTPHAPAAGHTDELGERWVTAALAARMTSISKRQIARFAEQGVIERKAGPDGAWLYSLDELEPLAKEDVNKAELERVKNDALREAHAHARESFALVHGPSKDLLQLYKEEVTALRARVVQLETTHDQNVAAREALLTEKHLRDLASKEAAARGKRWDQALATLQRVAAPLAMQLAGSLGGGNETPLAIALSRLDLSRLPQILNVEAMNADELAIMGELMSSIQAQNESNPAAAGESEGKADGK